MTEKLSADGLEHTIRVLYSLDSLHMPVHKQGHLDEQEMYQYVSGTAAQDTKRKLVAHMKTCGDCRKAVLRLKANYIDRNPSIEPVNTDLLPHLHKVWGNVISIFRWRMPVWSGAVAVLGLSVGIAWMMQAYINDQMDHSVVAHNTDTQASLHSSAPEPVNDSTQGNAGQSDYIKAAEHSDQTFDRSNNTTIEWHDKYVVVSSTGSMKLESGRDKTSMLQRAEAMIVYIAFLELSAAINEKAKDVAFKPFVTDFKDPLPILGGVGEILKRGEIHSKVIEWHEDRVDVTIVLRVPLHKRIPTKVIEKQNKKPSPNIISPPKSKSPELMPVNRIEKKELPSPEEPVKGLFSAVIFDASNIGFLPTMLPRIVDNENQLVYQSKVTLGGSEKDMYYYSSMLNATSSEKIGENPLTIKAIGLGDDGAIVINKQSLDGKSIEKLVGSSGVIAIVF